MPGEFIGLSNDDNYYVPGYLEQIVNALADADIAMCEILHSYSGWAAVPAGQIWAVGLRVPPS